MPVKKKAAPAKKSAAKTAAPARKTAATAKAPAKKAPAKKAPGAKKASGVKKPAARKSAAKKTTTRRGASTTLGIPATSLPPAVLPPPPGKAARGPRDMGPETPGTALARAVADAADMKKAEHIAILDVRGLSMVTDFLVIVSAGSMPHLRAIRNEVAERIHEERNEKPHSTQGAAESHWMLLDYGDVVAHIFLEEKRALYALEDLWSDAPRLSWSPPA
ncbi:MAG: ribosome silencing factor [Verrucomicrobiota bacterium]